MQATAHRQFASRRCRASAPCFPLLGEVHGRLMASGRGSEQLRLPGAADRRHAEHDPGSFRRSQNWIGGTRPGNATFVPPPAQEVATCMSDLERFFHAPVPGLSALLRAGLAHVQFETIHPFLDGNGRVRRLLTTLLLYHYKVLDEHLLYLRALAVDVGATDDGILHHQYRAAAYAADCPGNQVDMFCEIDCERSSGGGP